MIKYILYLTVLFFVMYFSSVDIGPVKLSHLFKGLIVAILFLLNFFNYFSNIRKNRFAFLLLILGFSSIINPYFFDFYFDNISYSLEILSFPLFFGFFYNYNAVEINKILKYLSFFFILTCIPIQLGFIDPIVTGRSLDLFGGEGATGFVGLFESSHACAMVLTFSSLYLFYNIHHEKKINSNLDILQILIFVYSIIPIYFSYVRTAYLVFTLGLLVIYFSKYKFSFIQLVRVLILLAASYIILTQIFSRDIIFQNRIQDQRVEGFKSRSEGTFDEFASGRGRIWIGSIKSFNDSSIIDKLIGKGPEESKNSLYRNVGLKLIPHNGFIGYLVSEGLIGLILYFLGFLSLLNRKSVLSITLFFTILAYNSFQGNPMFFMNLLLSLLLIKSEFQNDKFKRHLYS